MASIQLIIRPCDSGRTVETSLVSGGLAEEILPIAGGQNEALIDFLALVRAGSDTTGIETYLALENKTTADAYFALSDKELADAAITITNMSPAQKAGLLAYIAAIVAEADTSSVETAITNL